MNKLLCFFVMLIFVFSSVTVNASAISLSAECAVVIDAYSGKVLYEKSAHTKHGMASTTKIMTALTAIESCEQLDVPITVADEAIGIEGSSIYLTKGEKLTMRQLLYALMLQSANDAAAAIAFEVSGSIEKFASLMNEKALEMGLTNTHFTNPHGLFDEDHYTTAYELALITKKALEDPIFKEIVSTNKTIIPLNGDEGSRVLVNHNKLLKTYDGAIGVKTGFTKKTGRCLVSAAEKNGTTIIAVTLNAPSDWNDHSAMLDLGFESIKTYNLAEPYGINYKIPVVGGNSEYVNVSNREGLKHSCTHRTAVITSELILDRFLFAPVEADEIMGQIIFYEDGKEIGRVDLISQSGVSQKNYKKDRKKLFGIF